MVSFIWDMLRVDSALLGIHSYCFQDIAKTMGLVRDSNPGPLAPKARIIPLDQRATLISLLKLPVQMSDRCLLIATNEAFLHKSLVSI